MVWIEWGGDGPSGRGCFEGHRDLDLGWVSVVKTLGSEVRVERFWRYRLACSNRGCSFYS